MKPTHVLALFALATVSSTEAATFFGVTDINELVTFDSNNPGTFSSAVPITGTADDILDIAYDIEGDRLFGIDFAGGIYNISTTGSATLLNGSFAPNGFNLGLAYDPIDNTLLGTSDAMEFFAIDAITGAPSFGPDTIFEPFDTNASETAGFEAFGIDPLLGSSFAIDPILGVLASGSFFAQNEFVTIGNLGVDVFGSPSLTVTPDGELFAAFDSQVGFGTSLYSIDALTGAATEIGETSSAVLTITAVPEPSASALAALAGLFLIGRRRR